MKRELTAAEFRRLILRSAPPKPPKHEWERQAFSGYTLRTKSVGVQPVVTRHTS